jgi:hypothetical protein
LYLVAAPAGSARDHYLRALVDESVRRGERLLVLAPTPAAADRLADLLAAADHPLVRAASAGPQPNRTPHAHGEGLVAATRQALTQTIRDAEDRLTRWDAIAPLWGRIRSPSLEEADADAKRNARQAELVALREQLKSLSRSSDARRSGRLLSGSFWRSVFSGDVAGKKGELEKRIREAEDAIRASDDRSASEQSRRAGDFRLLCDELRSAGVDPPSDPSGLATAEAEFAACRTRTEAGLAFARRRLADVTADEPGAAMRFLARVRVVVTHPAGVDDSAVLAARFDRLVVESAESVSEAEFRAAARHADRWVLSGSPRESDYPYMNGSVQARRNGSHNTAGVFAHWWDRLHRPTWRVEGGRLVCRLAEVPRHTLTCEPCADRPEIELRFGAAAGGPVVAEIAFPDASPDAAAEAKAFLARELGEVRLNPFGSARWIEAGGRLAVEWPAAGEGGFGTELVPGVREYAIVLDGIPVTTRVTFDPAAGWDRPAAQRWVEQHSAAARTSRTARLTGGVPAAAEACLV